MPDSSPSPLQKLENCLLRPNCVLSVYCLAAVIATLVKLASGPFEQNGIHYQPLQNFAIFRNSFYHLIHHQNLYARFDFEQWDFYRYSPAFALLFAPFALLPYALGAVLWNLVNAASLYWAVRWVPLLDDRQKMLALWFLFLAMLNSVANAQSNALVAALMIFAWSAHERGKPDALRAPHRPGHLHQIIRHLRASPLPAQFPAAAETSWPSPPPGPPCSRSPLCSS